MDRKFFDWLKLKICGSDSHNSALIEKMFEGPKTSVLGNENIKRCNIHNENKIVSAKKIKVTKNSKCVLTVLNVK